MLPNFLFIGAEKSGTTWFYRRLKEHPDIFLPETKEIHFFNRYNSNLVEHDHYARFSLSWYENFFRTCGGERVVGEVTPMYLCDPCAPERIKIVLPKVKLICCLRNPVDRAYSHYWMARRKEHTHLSFAQVIESREPRFIERGLYHKQLQAYFDLFAPEQVLVLIHEEVFRQPARALQRVCRFLEVNPSFPQVAAETREEENASAEYRSPRLLKVVTRAATLMRGHKAAGRLLDTMKAVGLTDRVKMLNRKERGYPPMRSEQRSRLEAYYTAGIARLEALLGRSIDVWY